MQNPNLKRRKFLNLAAGSLSALGAFLALVPFMRYMLPSDLVRALGAPLEVDLQDLDPGAIKVVEWRGRPIWIVRRTPEVINELASDVDRLADPESRSSTQPDEATGDARAINPEFLVLVGICTHLGCSPLYRPEPGDPEVGADWRGGFFCPCHGSRFDMSGRVYKNMPAPSNLEVPPYRFTDSGTGIIIGT